MSQLGVEEGQTFNPDKLVRADSGNHRLIYAGRLDWIKGLDLAIEALDRLPPTFTFAIYGRGPAEPRLKALVAALGLTGRVQFTPPVSRDELVGIYSSGSLFLFPSSESAGLAWVEALTCGLPVVGFEGESSELALAQSSLNGIHLALNGPTREDAVQSLASTIQSAIGDETDPRHTRDKAIGKYSWDQKSATILQAYRSLSKRH
nr:glycosyltransferase [uncultured Holophaga sp.]